MQKGLFSSRRGQMDTSMQVFIMDMIIMTVLLGVMLHQAAGLDDNTIIQKEYIARDMALLLNTLYAAPVDVKDFVYSPTNFDLSRFRIDISEGRVHVEDTEAEGGTIYYPFAKNRFMESDVQKSLQDTQSIALSNMDGVVMVDDGTTGMASTSSAAGPCTGVKEGGGSIHKILLHPQQTDPLSAPGSFEDADYDSGIMWDIAEQLSEDGFRGGEGSPDTRVTPQEPGEAVEVEGYPSLIVSLAPSVAAEEVAPVNIRYLGSGTGRAVACSLKRSFEDSGKLSSELDSRVLEVSVKKAHQQSLPSSHPAHGREDTPTVLISFGNVALGEEAMYGEASGEVMQSIDKGISGYYE